MKSFFTALLTILFSLNTFAVIEFESLTKEEVDNVAKEFSGNFYHNTVMGAEGFGSIWGFELGFTGAQTGTPNTNTIVKRSSPGSDLPNLYNVSLVAGLTVPFGITAELAYLPTTTLGDFEVGSTSIAGKVSMNEFIPVLPINLSLRGFYTDSKMKATSLIPGGTANYDLKNTVTGFQLLLSPKLPMLEPYVGIGMLSGSNTFTVGGAAANGAAFPFTISNSVDSSYSTTQYMLGINASLGVLTLGAEYSNAFSTSRYAGKIAFGF